jgi:hypothetical protein
MQLALPKLSSMVFPLLEVALENCHLILDLVVKKDQFRD